MNPNLQPKQADPLRASDPPNSIHDRRHFLDSPSTAALPSLAVTLGMAILLALVGILLRWVSMPLLGPSSPFLLIAIIISAWYGGLWPGLLTTVIAAVAALTLPVVAPPMPINVSGVPLFSSILVLGILISLLQESLHRAHRKASQSSRKIAESNRRFSLLVDNVKDYGVFMLDAQGHIESWNTGAQAITGYSASEIIGRHFSIFYPTEDVAAGRPENELRIAAQTGRYEEESWRVRKDGSRFWSNVVVTAIRDEDGVLRGFSKVTRDMTERKQAEERSRLLAEEQAARFEAEAANKAKDQFLSIVSHELRTPLNAILGWASLLRSGRLDEETSAQALDTIERCSRVQSRLVEDLLDVSRMLAGKMFIDSTPLEMRKVVDAVVARMLPQATEKEIEINVSCEGAGWVKGDSVRIEQVLGNLMSNAIKFTPRAGRVTITMREDKSNVEVRVSDNGEGISPDILPHIFDHFRQADSSQTRSHGGLGLGLAIARYVVESLHGEIEAESEGKGKGATFTIRLPLYEHRDRAAHEVANDESKLPDATRA